MNISSAASFQAHPRFTFYFDFAMYWMPSEQAREFDHWLRLPVLDRELLETTVREHFVRVSRIPPNGAAKLVYESFDILLRQLSKGNEDVDRLTLWFASQFEGLSDLGMRPDATRLWTNALEEWAWSESLALRAEMHGIDRHFVTSYHETVLVPYSHVDEEARRADKRWKSADRRLGEFDKLVADLYFDGVRGSPASFLTFFIERRLHREWWRTARSLLSPEQIRALTEELVEHVSDTDIPEMIPWEHVIDIDAAFTIDLFPVFDEVAAADVPR